MCITTLNRITASSTGFLLIGCLFASRALAAEAEPFECLKEPLVVTQVGSPVQEIIERLLVDRSDYVTRGRPIAQLESAAETINLVSARARASMQSEVSAREADLTLIKLNLASVQKLHEQNLVPTQIWDEPHVQKLVASATPVQALENLKLAHLDPLRIEVCVPARLFGSFKPGDTAVIRPEIEHAEPLQATVQVVGQLLNTAQWHFRCTTHPTQPPAEHPRRTEVPIGIYTRCRAGVQ